MKTADAKPAPKAPPRQDLPATLASIAAAEHAEQTAGRDAYDRLVLDLIDGHTDLSAGEVVAVLKRAGRTAEELAEDVKTAQELATLEAEHARLPDRLKAAADARDRLAAAHKAVQQAAEEAAKPVPALQAAVDAAQRDELACRDTSRRITELKRVKAERDARRAGLVKRFAASGPVVEYVAPGSEG